LVAYTQAQKPLDPFEEAMRQRQMYLETFGVLPGELFAEEGKELFHRKGPSGKTLEACDFGKGPGVLEGVYAQPPQVLPRQQAGGGPGVQGLHLHADRPGL
jgi:sulfur-oxidizing protein SoxA